MTRIKRMHRILITTEKAEKAEKKRENYWCVETYNP